MKAFSMLYLMRNRGFNEEFSYGIMLTSNCKINLKLSSKLLAQMSSITNLLYNIYDILICFIFRGRMEMQKQEQTLVAFSSQFLMNKAARIMLQARSQPSSQEMQMLIPRGPINPWRATGDLEKSILISSYCGYCPVMGVGCDRNCMAQYLRKVKVDGIQIPRDTRFSDFLPAGAPILDFLSVSMEKMECWRYPSISEIRFYQENRGLSVKMLQEVRVREIIIGETSSEECAEIFKWFWDHYEKDQKLLPSSVISMDNEEIKISLMDIYYMAGKIETRFPRRIADYLVEHDLVDVPEDRWMQLPVRIMLGNGISHALMITISLERDSRNEYILNRIHIQDEVIEFLESIPVCMGLGVRVDVADVEYFYSLFSGRTVNLKGFLDLSSFAVLTGYNLRAMSMTPMGVNIVGHTLNKCCSTGDGKWSYRWEEIPDPLKIYCLGDLRFGYMTYNTLAAVFIRDLFPDPDIVCKFLGITNQIEAVRWILELVLLSLDGVEVHNVDFDAAQTRLDMVKSLRFRYSYDSPLMESSPARVMIWCELLGNWPALTHGGCRFLNVAREWFLHQARILKFSGFKWSCGVQMRDVNPAFLSYARFGLSAEKIRDANYWEPVIAHSGLFRPESLKSRLLCIDPGKVKPATLCKFAKLSGRVLKAVVFEWARFYPNKIQAFLQRMKDDEGFLKFTAGLYRGLRIIYKRIHDHEALKIPMLDLKFRQNLDSHLQGEKHRMERSRRVLEARKARVAHISSVLEEPDDDDKTLWLEDIPKLPEWVPRRRAKKRPNSVSSAGPNSKKIRVGSTPGQDESLAPADPGRSSDMVEIEEDQDGEDVVILEEEDLLEIPGINDPKPVCRKIVPQKKKKKKGKKGKKKTKVPEKKLTYDEIIEAGTYQNSDDEFELEFDFSGHLA